MVHWIVFLYSDIRLRMHRWLITLGIFLISIGINSQEFVLGRLITDGMTVVGIDSNNRFADGEIVAYPSEQGYRYAVVQTRFTTNDRLPRYLVYAQLLRTPGIVLSKEFTTLQIGKLETFK